MRQSTSPAALQPNPSIDDEPAGYSTAMRRRRSPLGHLPMKQVAPTRTSLRSIFNRMPGSRCRWFFILWFTALVAFRWFTDVSRLNPTERVASNPWRPANVSSSSFWPGPIDRESDGDFESTDPRYRPFKPLDPPIAPFPRLLPTRFMPAHCMEHWFADGELRCDGSDLGEEEQLDATWLWVNGSDPRWRASMLQWRANEGIFSPEHHFREQNELVYSMRSVVQALPGGINTVHLVVADFDFAERDNKLLPSRLRTAARTDTWRVAQVPTWLNFTSVAERAVTVSSATKIKLAPEGSPSASAPLPRFRYATHSEVFRLPSPATPDLMDIHESRERDWRANALPSFNSMSIESRLGWIPDLHEVTLALNDDFFILTPHAVSDFHSPLYGSVIRFDNGYYQQVKPILDKTRVNDAGEVSGLYHANYILSKRFPRRLRPYFAHAPKVITRSLHHEASLMFESHLTTSSQRRFREVHHGQGDIQMQWLLSSLRVERWREALLWTYVVARMGHAVSAQSGVWDSNVRRELYSMFDLNSGDVDVIKIEVHRGARDTLNPERLRRNFAQAGWEAPKATEMLFSSMDGHLPPIPKPGMPANQFDKCVLDLERCFGTFWTDREDKDASFIFKRLAFQNSDCGDCLINALVTSSGALGLSAFLPPRDSVYQVPGHLQTDLPKPAPPHLPLTSTWQEADFCLAAVLRDTARPGETVGMRQYTMKLLSRYQYLYGLSNSHFHQLFNPSHTAQVFESLDADRRVSILGLNDDIDSGYDEVKALMGKWLESRWPRKLPWERGYPDDL